MTDYNTPNMDWFRREDIFKSRTGLVGTRIHHPSAPAHDFVMPVRPSPTYHDLYPRFDAEAFTLTLPASPPYAVVLAGARAAGGPGAEFPDQSASAAAARAFDFRAEYPDADPAILDLAGRIVVRLRLPPPHDHWSAGAPDSPAAPLPAVLASKPRFQRLSTAPDDRAYQDAWIRVLHGDPAQVRFSEDAPAELRAIFAHEPVGTHSPAHHHMIMDEMLRALARKKRAATDEQIAPLVGALMVSGLARFPPARDRSLAMLVDALSGAADLDVAYFAHVPCTVALVAEALRDAGVLDARESTVGAVLEQLLQHKHLVVPDHERDARIDSFCTAAVLKYYFKCPLLMRANGDVGKSARLIRAVYKLHARNMIVTDAAERRVAERAFALITQHMLAAASAAALFSASRDVVSVPAVAKLMNELPREIRDGKYYFSRFFVEDVVVRYVRATGLSAARALTADAKAAILGAAHLALVRGRDGRMLDIRGLMSDIYASLPLQPVVPPPTMSAAYYHVPSLARACDMIVDVALRGSAEDRVAAFMIMDGRRWMSAADEIELAQDSAVVRADVAAGAQWLREQIPQPDKTTQERTFALDSARERSWTLAATVDLGPPGRTQPGGLYAGWLWTPSRDPRDPRGGGGGGRYWIKLDVLAAMSTLAQGRFATLRLDVPVEDGAEGVFVPIIGRGNAGGMQWSLGPAFTMIIQKRSRRPPYALYEEAKNNAEATTWTSVRSVPGRPDDRPHELTLRGWHDDAREDPYALSSEALMGAIGRVVAMNAGALVYGVAGMELARPWEETMIMSAPYAGAPDAALVRKVADAQMSETAAGRGGAGAGARKLQKKIGLAPRVPTGYLLNDVYEALLGRPGVDVTMIVRTIEEYLNKPMYSKERELAFMERIVRGDIAFMRRNRRAAENKYEEWIWEEAGLKHMIIETAAAYLEVLWMRDHPLLSRPSIGGGGEGGGRGGEEVKKEEDDCVKTLEKFMRENTDPIEIAMPAFMRLLICFMRKTRLRTNPDDFTVVASVNGFLSRYETEDFSPFMSRITDPAQRVQLDTLLQEFMNVWTVQADDTAQKRVRSYFLSREDRMLWKYLSPSEKTNAVVDASYRKLTVNELCEVAMIIAQLNSVGRTDFMPVDNEPLINAAWNRYLLPSERVVNHSFAEERYYNIGMFGTGYDPYLNVFVKFVSPLIYNMCLVAATSKAGSDALDLKLLSRTFKLMITENVKSILDKDKVKELFYHIDFVVRKNNVKQVFEDSVELDNL